MRYNTLRTGKSIPLTDKYKILLISKKDIADIIETLHNPNVTEYLYFAPSPDEVYIEFFNPLVENTESAVKEGIWPDNPTMIIRGKDGKYFGMGGLNSVAMLEGNYEVGYQLPEHAWGKGIGTAICGFLTKFAFDVLSAHKICADCYSGNAGSVRVLEKNNFNLEGRQKDYYKLGGKYDDRLLFGINLNQYSSIPNF